MPVSGDDRLLAQRAVAAGLAVQALSDWRMRHTGEGGITDEFYQYSLAGNGWRAGPAAEGGDLRRRHTRWYVKNPCGQRRAGVDAYLLSSLLSVKQAGFRTLIARRQQTL